MTLTAIVVARGGSVRLPKKALLPFGGTTLVGHKVRTLLRCRYVTQVVVGSDSSEILLEAARNGAWGVTRDAYHCDESRCTANEMLADMAQKVEGDDIAWCHPTNPLISSGTYDAAIDAYRAGLAQGYDSLVSVYEVRRHAWMNGKCWEPKSGTAHRHPMPINYDPWAAVHAPAKDCAPIYFQDGSVFIQPREQMLANRYFFGTKPKLFIVPPEEVADIDSREDYEAAVGRNSARSPRISAS